VNGLIPTWHHCTQLHVAAFSKHHAIAATGTLTKEPEKRSASVTTTAKPYRKV